MIASVMSTPILQRRIAELANKRIAVEEKEGLFNKSERAYESKKIARQNAIEESLREVCEKTADGMICKMESNTFIRGAYYMCTELLTRAYHQGMHFAFSYQFIRANDSEESTYPQKKSSASAKSPKKQSAKNSPSSSSLATAPTSTMSLSN